MDLKKGKIGIFAKGIRHNFGQSVEDFSSIVFMKNTWIFDCLHRKETFKLEKKPLKTIKISLLEKRKIRIFRKVSPSCSSKM